MKDKFVTKHGTEIDVVQMEDLPGVLGIGPADTVEIATPQFHRNKGEQTPGIPTDWGELRNLDVDELRNRGLKRWSLKGQDLLLFPGEWYLHIPAGYEVVDILGEIEPFMPGQTDDDIRFGCLAFGIIAAEKNQ